MQSNLMQSEMYSDFLKSDLNFNDGTLTFDEDTDLSIKLSVEYVYA